MTDELMKAVFKNDRVQNIPIMHIIEVLNAVMDEEEKLDDKRVKELKRTGANENIYKA